MPAVPTPQPAVSVRVLERGAHAEATPRYAGGTLSTMDGVFGEENMPWPSPWSNSRAAKGP
ncbi:hypothetical protein [Streptomyces sp. NPDC050564]|uniref:hypothetical protein n=1 Tax=Streptomyces sp. NPDC050564 TaxID=3365631 RepID=UPI0037971B9B